MSRLLPFSARSRDGYPGMTLREAQLSLGLYTFNLPKPELWKETFALNSKGLSLSMSCLGTAMWRSELDQLFQSNRSIVSGGLNPAHCANMWVFVAPQGKAPSREGNQPGDAGCLSQQLLFQLTACIKPWPLAIPILGLYFIQQQEGITNANIHISGFFCSFFCA